MDQARSNTREIFRLLFDPKFLKTVIRSRARRVSARLPPPSRPKRRTESPNRLPLRIVAPLCQMLTGDNYLVDNLTSFTLVKRRQH